MRVPTFRQLSLICLAGVLVTLVVAVVLSASGTVSAGPAAVAVLGAVLLAGVVLLAGLVRRLDEKVQRLNARHARSEESVERSERENGRRHDDLVKRLGDLDEHVSKAREWVSQDVFTAYQQVEAMIDLRALVSPRAPMPALRHWALSPDALRLIIREVHARRPGLIVECGSGASSVWLGYVVQALGTGRIVSLEHDERFANATQDLIRAHELQDVVEVRYAPLTPWQGENGPKEWYDTAVIGDLESIGLLVVDGPPGTGGPAARYPAGPELLPRCAPDALILLDDAHRADERAVSDRWLKENEGLVRTEYTFDKHLHAFELAPGNA